LKQYENLLKLPSWLFSHLCRFYLGFGYPLCVAFIVLLGHCTGLEFYLNFLNIILFVIGTLSVDSVKPFLAIFLTYTYQISLRNTPSFPVHSDYYLEGARPYFIALMFILGIGAFVYSLIRRGIFTRESFGALPMKISSLFLVAALLLGGAFGGDYSVFSTIYGFAVAFSVVALFYVFYLAFKRESADGLLDYMILISTLIALIVTIETLHLYLTSDNLFRDGSVVKDNVLYGWGIWNNAGQKLTVVIPMVLLGAIRAKNPTKHLAVATLALGAAVLTLSRTALIFATLAYLSSLVIACFKAKSKRLFRILTLAVFGVAVIGAILLHEKIFSILADYLERGLDDNGRYALWQYGIDSFLEAPILGKGFFGLHTDTFISIGFIPQMMHNTPIQLLAATGAFGLCAYLWHRAETLRPFVIHPSTEKTMIGISLLTVLFGSLLENFVFYVEPMFFFSVALALAFRVAEEKRDQ